MRNILPVVGLTVFAMLALVSSSAWGQRSPNPDKGIVWQASIGGSADEAAHALKLTSDGGCLIAGYARSRDGDIAEPQGRKDFLVARLDAAGKVLWKKTYGGKEDDVAYAVDATTDGGFVIAGSTESWDWGQEQYHGATDFWIIKIDGSGNLLWRRWYGGSGNDIAMSVRTLADGSFIIGGFSDSRNGNVKANLGESDAWVLKLDSQGLFQWCANLGGEGIDGAFSVTAHAAGGYFVSGQKGAPEVMTGGFGLPNHFFGKVSAQGKVEWGADYGDVGEELTMHAEPLADGGYIAVGSTNNLGGISHGSLGARDVHLMRLDANGQISWEKFFGGTDDDVCYKVRTTADGGFVMVGETNSYNHDVLGTHGRPDIWLVKLSSAGEIQWQKCFGGKQDDRGYDVAETSDGAYIVAGLGTWLHESDMQSGHAGADAWVFKYKP